MQQPVPKHKSTREEVVQSQTCLQLTFNRFLPIYPFHCANAFLSCFVHLSASAASFSSIGHLSSHSGHVPATVRAIACHAHLASPCICTQSPLRTRSATVRLISPSSPPRPTTNTPSHPKLKLASPVAHSSLTSRCTGMKSLPLYSRHTPLSDTVRGKSPFTSVARSEGKAAACSAGGA